MLPEYPSTRIDGFHDGHHFYAISDTETLDGDQVHVNISQVSRSFWRCKAEVSFIPNSSIALELSRMEKHYRAKNG